MGQKQVSHFYLVLSTLLRLEEKHRTPVRLGTLGQRLGLARPSLKHSSLQGRYKSLRGYAMVTSGDDNHRIRAVWPWLNWRMTLHHVVQVKEGPGV